MKHIFITYGDEGFESAKSKIVKQARSSGVFDEVIAYGRDNLSKELLASEVINIKKGGGLWSWKPDIILTTMENSQEGDCIIYCDAGCTIYQSSEWNKLWKILVNHDIIAQRIFQENIKWTRKEIIDFFKENGTTWLSKYQYQATIILKVSYFSKQFVREWRNLMIEHPDFAMDVPAEKRVEQMPGFIENRHDQAIYSSLIYKYLNNPLTKDLIYTQWEHIEDYDPFFKQGIRATRLRNGEDESRKAVIIAIIKRLIKDYIYKPFYYAPRQWWIENL